MKFVLEHLKSQTIPHDMLDELRNSEVKFYEGCLIVQVQDHRTVSGTSSSTTTKTSKTEKNVPFSIHNYNEHLTPSPYVPYPQKEDSVAENSANKSNPQTKSESASGAKDKQPEKGPKIFTVVLFPTPLSLQEEVYIQANTPVDSRNNRKQSATVPRTPASATIPPTPLSAVPPTPSASGPPPPKKLKMSISGSDIHAFESKAITTTAPPLFLEPIDNINDAHRVMQSLTDPLHKEPNPTPKARKRTQTELAADEAIADREQKFMLIMDERRSASGAAGVKAGAADGEGGTATFEPRFESFQAIKNIKAEHKERAERELVEKRAAEAAAAANKLRMEQQAQLNRQETEQRAVQLARDQQQQRNMQQQQAQMRDAQRQQALAAGQNQLAHGHPMPNGVSQAQNSSPIVRNMTPNVNSSPLVNSIPMSSHVTSSPVRPTSAAQHGHPGGVAMAQQRSRQRAPSRTSTPQLNGTPSMQHATPRMPQGSPPMVGQIMNHNAMASQHLNGPPPALSQQQTIEIRARQQQQRAYAAQLAQQQRMQNGSPNAQMSPDRNPAHMNLQHQAAMNQQRQQQHEYHARLSQATLATMQNGSSPLPQHVVQPGHPQMNPRMQFNPSQLPEAHRKVIEQKTHELYQQLMNQCLQKYGGNAQLITQAEKMAMSQRAIQAAQEFYRSRMAADVQRRQQAVAQMHMQQQQGVNGMNGSAMNGMGGQGITEEQIRISAAMRQFSQMPHIGGGGVQNVNGVQHNPHMNGVGMGGMQ